MSWTIIFNEATFRKILVPSLDNANDYVYYLKETCGPGWEQQNLTNCAIWLIEVIRKWSFMDAKVSKTYTNSSLLRL